MLPLAPSVDATVRVEMHDGRTVVAVMALVRVLDSADLAGVVPGDRVPRHAVAARRRLEEREELVASGEAVSIRVAVIDRLGEAIGDHRRVALGPPGGGSDEHGLELVASQSSARGGGFAVRPVGIRLRFVLACHASTS